MTSSGRSRVFSRTATKPDCAAPNQYQINSRRFGIQIATLLPGVKRESDRAAARFASLGLPADGTLKFLQRLKDGYKHKGFNVSTPEIEAVVSKHRDVAAVAVVGVPDQLYGEIGIAFVVLRMDSVLSTNLLIEYMSERLASYKIPSHVFAVDALPVTAGTEKVQKFRLRELAMEFLANAERRQR